MLVMRDTELYFSYNICIPTSFSRRFTPRRWRWSTRAAQTGPGSAATSWPPAHCSKTCSTQCSAPGPCTGLECRWHFHRARKISSSACLCPVWGDAVIILSTVKCSLLSSIYRTSGLLTTEKCKSSVLEYKSKLLMLLDDLLFLPWNLLGFGANSQSVQQRIVYFG